jgi:transcriptional regulator with XRE-family HTH domain
MTVGQRIRHFRLLRGLSHLRMAERMERVARGHGGTAATRGGQRTQLSKWEHDLVTPNQHNRRLIAETLQVSVADLGLYQDPYFRW